jgi:hypothetical protein
MTHRNKRRRLFIDRPVQGTLLLRAASYWAVCLITQLLIVFLFVLLTSSSGDWNVNGARMWWHVQVSLVASFAILPMILLDVLKLSHRWVGPLFRLRSSLKAISRGEPIQPIKFRENDFWQGLADDVNVLTEELNHLRATPRSDEDPTGASLFANAAAALGGSQKVANPARPAPLSVSSDAYLASGAAPTVPIASG